MKIITKAVMDMETLEWVFEESYEYAGPVAQCCGPTNQEHQEAQQSQQFTSAVDQNYGTLFNEQEAAQANLSDIFTPIAEGNAPGLGAQGLTAEQTLALDTTGANYRNAAQALNSQQAGRGADTGLQSGPQRQQQAQLASAAAGQTSSELLGIQQQNANLQQQQIQNAQSGLLALSGQYNPNATADTAVKSSSNAYGQASDIAAQEAQEQQDIGSGIETLATLA